MDVSSPRRSWLLGFLALAALAAAPRAGAAETRGPRPAPRAAEDLSQGAAGPDDLKAIVEGSRERQGGVDAPRADASIGPRGQGVPLRLSPPERELRPEGPVVPAASVSAARRADAPLRFDWTPGLKTRKLAAVLGLGLMLIAGSWLESPPEPGADAGEGAPALTLRAPRPRPEAPRAPEPDLESSRLARALAEPTFLDTRMPAPTWRAISWREQRLIDGWDASAEKAAGLASLTDWLDAKGGADGVNVLLLKAKLFREA